MRTTLTSILSILLLGSVILQGCVATIVSTPKQKVTISSSPSRSTVYVDDKKVGLSTTEVRIKRNEGAEITIEKEGYKTHTEIVYPAKLNPVALISIIFLIYPYNFDVATGAAFKLNKDVIKVDLIKLPRTIDGSQVIVCDEVSLKIRAGDKLGNIYIRDKREEIIYFGRSLDVDDTNLKTSTNTLLNEVGFEVARSSGSIFSSNMQARYFMRAEIEDISYDIRASHPVQQYAKYETNCEMRVRWYITNRAEEVLFEETVTGSSTTYEKGGSTAFYEAFDNSLYLFLYNDEVYDIAQKEPEAFDPSANFSMIKIGRPGWGNVPEENIINASTQAIVTIDNGDSHGSGCVISTDGYIVTNHHVVEGLESVTVVFKDGLSIPGDVVRYNEEFDLALIKVNVSGLASIPVSQERSINVGSDVFAIGTPADKELGQTVTKGIISGTRSVLERTLIQTDVSINPGSSGGGLIDKRGNLVGVVNAKLVGASVEGIGFAIPSYEIFDRLKISY